MQSEGLGGESHGDQRRRIGYFGGILPATKGQHEDDERRNYESEFLTPKRGVVNQGSEELPDITVEETELALESPRTTGHPR